MKREEPLIRIVKDNKRFLIKRPHPFLKATSSYQQAFQQEALLSKACKHPNLLTCMGVMEWEGESVICYNYESALPLPKAILEFSERSKGEMSKLIHQVMDAVIYLHAQGVLHADIHPNQIYITKQGCNVKLINSAQPYLEVKPSSLLLRATYTPPERLEGDAQPTCTTDVYAIGKVMEFVYSYSRITVGIHRVITKATHPDPAKRYATVAEMKRAFNQAAYWDWGVTGIKAAAVIGVMTLCYYGLAGEKPTKEDISFFEDSKIAHSKAEANQEQSAEAASYTQQLPLTATTDNESVVEEEQLIIAQKLFKSEFRKVALPVIKRIYTPQLMNGSEENFQQQSLDGFAELDQIQRQLATDMGLSLRSAAQLASEIITELTQQSMTQLRKEATNPTE